MCGGGLTAQPRIPGCTKPTALNFNKIANKDDGSCRFTVFGCMKPAAENYNNKATRDDGSCKFVGGCMNRLATNYNPKATKNDGSCKFPVLVVPVYGCMDKFALNYNKLATRENGSCKFKKVVPKTTGCFNGPMAGKFYKKTSKTKTVRAKPWCRIVAIQSCNQSITINGPIWCYMKMTYDPRDNCPDLVAASGACANGKGLGQCHKENVTGDLNEVWMYESNYKGKVAEPQPSGFYLKFGNSWTRLFGSTGNKKAKKWSSKSVAGNGAQFYGVTFDNFKQADFLQFHMCTGGLAAVPVIDVPPPTEPVDIVVMQSGCFDGPMGGMYEPKFSTRQTDKAESYCRLREITSCNQKKTTNGPIWCKMTQRFTNCPDMTVHSGECVKDENVGQCVTHKVDGDIQAITMYESYYKGNTKKTMPSGFSLKFSRSGSFMWGSTGNNKPKSWTVKNVVGQRAQLFGVTYDSTFQADYLQFHMCAGGLTQAPSPVPVINRVVAKQSGCFNGPMAGQFYPKTSQVATEKIPSYCKITQLTSCN